LILSLVLSFDSSVDSIPCPCAYQQMVHIIQREAEARRGRQLTVATMDDEARARREYARRLKQTNIVRTRAIVKQQDELRVLDVKVEKAALRRQTEMEKEAVAKSLMIRAEHEAAVV
jgi:hypothetical protein